MRKIFYFLCFAICFAALFCGCSREFDYSQYISELRYDIYIYSGDSEEIKVYCAQREVPYAADGIKGEMNPVTEIYASFERNCSSVYINLGGYNGDMGYLSVKNCWYLSFTDSGFDGDTIDASVEIDGKNYTYTLISVLNDGVMEGKDALACVQEFNGSLFESMTENGIFRGEIYIRLLYDGKCYYYVGICGREGNINAYLADGETGRIVAEHSS